MSISDPSTLCILRYDPDEVGALHQIVAECGEDMKRRYGLIHWSPPYPIETMRRNARDLHVYGVHQRNGDDADLIGTFTVGMNGWKHDSKLWSNPAHRPLYLGKLAIRPACQGKGLGKWCVNKVEELARAWDCQAVRFDAIAQHTRLLQFYQALNYKMQGTSSVVDWRGLEWEIVYFEKILL